MPFLEDQCLACHDEGFETSGLSMATVEAMQKGGRRGPAFVAGKGSESLIVQFLDGTRQPQMPPKTSIPRDQIAVIKRWIDQGAKVDALDPESARIAEARKAAESAAFASDAPPPVTSLAYSPDGKRLAVAGYREILVIDPATGRTTAPARRFSRPGDVRSPSTPTASDSPARGARRAGRGKSASGSGTRTQWREAGVLRGHDDTVLALAWRPKSDQIATSSLDKQILVWDAASGKVVRTIKSHADIVSALAFSPDGTRLASGSADKTAKVYDAETGLQVAGLSSHNEAVLCRRVQPRRQAPRHRRRRPPDPHLDARQPVEPRQGFRPHRPGLRPRLAPDGTSLAGRRRGQAVVPDLQGRQRPARREHQGRDPAAGLGLRRRRRAR